MKKQENLNSHGKGSSTETNSKIRQMLEFCDRDFKAAIIQILTSNHKHSRNKWKIESLSRGTQDVKKNQKEISELKNIVTKVKKSHIVWARK